MGFFSPWRVAKIKEGGFRDMYRTYVELLFHEMDGFYDALTRQNATNDGFALE